MTRETPRYERLDHTADTRLRIHGATLEALFENAAFALFDVIVADLEAMQPKAEVAITVEARDLPCLLVDWMNELLYRFGAREEIHAWPRVTQVGADRIEAVSGFRVVDWARDAFHTEVKSATYHGARAEHVADAWIGEVVLDL